MSIRFKFRSSVNFDSVDIEGRSSISVGELRSKIVLHKHLNICQDFDLVFSDALTAHEFHDENFQIPSGSSVIIKRVPAGSVPSAMAPINSVENLGAKDSNPVNPIGYFPLNAETDNFDDFGVDLCPIPEAALSDSDLEFDKNYCISNEKPKNALASNLGSSKALKSAPLSHKLKQTDGERVGYAHHEVFRSGDDSEACPDFQGESQPHNFPQSHVHEEAFDRGGDGGWVSGDVLVVAMACTGPLMMAAVGWPWMLRDCENRWKLSNENLGRVPFFMVNCWSNLMD
ncbi:hypothetical protein HYC85_027512 [Camellia sinensis]|uniref:DWNN domain-containing protein n=1 Tax=Camellia sinensis TaxID=4442 RepID=A0A7J7G6K1_CAMSI|nr:hypothetical protein HYC85_027512 [Camellia sinensis]